MQHNAAFHQGLYCLLRLKQSSGTEKNQQNLENPLKFTIGNPILVSICTYFIGLKVGEYDKEIPQSHATDQPTAP